MFDKYIKNGERDKFFRAKYLQSLSRMKNTLIALYPGNKSQVIEIWESFVNES